MICSETATRQRVIAVDQLTLNLLEAGEAEAPAFLFLHGWPQSASAFIPIMERLRADFHVLAVDLPEIGLSRGTPGAADKEHLAGIVHGLARAIGLESFVLVGHDVGGQIAFSYLRHHPNGLAGAAILSVAIPGIEPWSQVVSNLHIWHFAFHAVPDLPELLVAGHTARYFDYFYDAIAARPETITPAARAAYAQAYSRPEALKAGFDWYRAYAQDEKANGGTVDVEVPVLYLRGDKDAGDLGTYLKGLRRAGLHNLKGATIADSGHFLPEENPDALAKELAAFHPGWIGR